MLIPEDANLLVQFLDRCPTTGHKERNSLSRLVNILVEIATTKPKDPKKPKNGKTENP